MKDNLYHYKAKVISVWDGDTIRADVDLGFGIWAFNQKFRLANIDAPELRGRELQRGQISRDKLRKKILDKEVIIRTNKDKKGKYGRWICEIFVGGENVNEWMVSEGYAQFKTYEL
jgi:micrococcal nuclease